MTLGRTTNSTFRRDFAVDSLQTRRLAIADEIYDCDQGDQERRLALDDAGWG
jgi:hypothetical protein